MKNSRLTVVILVAVLGCVLSPRVRGESPRFTLFSSVWGDAIVVTDMTAEGRLLTPPTVDKPAYYLGQSLGSKLGSIPGDVAPEEKKFDEFVAKILAKQGYLGATPGVHEPTLFLVVQWGYLTSRWTDLTWFLGYDPNKDVGANFTPDFIGPEVFLKNMRPHAIEVILDTAKGPTYGIIITAFEYKSARTANPIALWQTRVGLSADRKSMAQALPAMIVAAGPTIGRETSDPVLSSADDARQGHVDLGELHVVGYDETPGPRQPEAATKK